MHGESPRGDRMFETRKKLSRPVFGGSGAMPGEGHLVKGEAANSCASEAKKRKKAER